MTIPAAYYSEWDKHAAAWLRELIKRGLIAPGDVDERSIVDISADDLRGYTQCHFFAGIGVWSHALRLAGWSDDQPVWTGSCPCQPFSAAGRGEGIEDARHLWPHFFRLIRECRPESVFGEQVAGKDGLAWLDHVALDLEAVGYAVGALSAPACGFGAPHRRERLYWVAHTERGAAERHGFKVGDSARGVQGEAQQWQWLRSDVGDGDFTCELADASSFGHDGRRASEAEGRVRQSERPGPTNGFWANSEWIACTDGKARATQPGAFPLAHGSAARVVRLRGYGNAIVAPQAAEFIRAFLDVTGGGHV